MMNYFDLKELGDYISNFMKEKEIDTENQLTITVDKNTLYKLDEDIYYRINPEGKDFKYADNEINLLFENLKIQIKAKE